MEVYSLQVVLRSSKAVSCRCVDTAAGTWKKTFSGSLQRNHEIRNKTALKMLNMNTFDMITNQFTAEQNFLILAFNEWLQSGLKLDYITREWFLRLVLKFVERLNIKETVLSSGLPHLKAECFWLPGIRYWWIFISSSFGVWLTCVLLQCPERACVRFWVSILTTKAATLMHVFHFAN